MSGLPNKKGSARSLFYCRPAYLCRFALKLLIGLYRCLRGSLGSGMLNRFAGPPRISRYQHRHELGGAMPGQRAQHHLPQALAGPHNAGGPHGLIRRDEQEALGIISRGGLGQDVGTQVSSRDKRRSLSLFPYSLAVQTDLAFNSLEFGGITNRVIYSQIPRNSAASIFNRLLIVTVSLPSFLRRSFNTFQ